MSWRILGSMAISSIGVLSSARHSGTILRMVSLANVSCFAFLNAQIGYTSLRFTATGKI